MFLIFKTSKINLKKIKLQSKGDIKLLNKMSFQKKRQIINIKGTKPSIQNGQLLVSTGNPSLNHLIGGGLPVGSVMLIEEDKHVSYSKVLTKYFLAEAILQEHPIFIANLERDPKNVMKKLPVAISANDSSKSMNDDDDMRIAWRYNALPKYDSEQVSSNVGVFYDLSKTVEAEIIEKHDVTYWNDFTPSLIEDGFFTCKKYQSLLNELIKKLKNPSFQKTESTEICKNILRISISSVGSPSWFEDGIIEDLLKFLVILKSLVKNTLSVCLLTMPTHLFEVLEENSVAKIRNLVDFSIELNSFAGTPNATNPVFKEYHGLFCIRKLMAFNSLSGYCPETHDLAFKLRRKKFVIEMLHLPPELQDSEAREQDDVPSSSCGSSKKTLLEF